MASSRRGRPPGGDSTQTHRRIVDAARLVFTRRGYAGGTISEIAQNSGLTASAIYHHFGGKASLYEEVFKNTSEAIWNDVSARSVRAPTLCAAIVEIVDNATHLSEHLPYYSDFLAMVPTEASLHPEFAHLLDRRAKNQDERFTHLAELGLATGELADLELPVATEIIRAAIMGWFFERHFRGGELPHGGEALVALFERLAAHRA